MEGSVESLRVKLFADSADLSAITTLAEHEHICGFTTNPTLMRKAGVDDYSQFVQRVVEVVPDLPVSFEVVADDHPEMLRQARRLASIGPNVHVKIPVTDPGGCDSTDLLRTLADENIHLNVTAVMTTSQVESIAHALRDAPSSFISVFAGRVADTGREPQPLMVDALQILGPYPHLQLMWASPREVLNVVQADSIGCHIITLTPDLIVRLELLGRDLEEFSLDTVRMFHRDAADARYTF